MDTIKITDVITMQTRTVPHTRDICTCGTCGLSWDDSIVTGITPTPSARCPFEYMHKPDPTPARASKDSGRWIYNASLGEVKTEAGALVCDVAQGNEARGALIAQAPAMRAALEAVLQHCVTVNGMPDKGKGRTDAQQAALDAARAVLAKAKP